MKEPYQTMDDSGWLQEWPESAAHANRLRSFPLLPALRWSLFPFFLCCVLFFCFFLRCGSFLLDCGCGGLLLDGRRRGFLLHRRRGSLLLDCGCGGFLLHRRGRSLFLDRRRGGFLLDGGGGSLFLHRGRRGLGLCRGLGRLFGGLGPLGLFAAGGELAGAAVSNVRKICIEWLRLTVRSLISVSNYCKRNLKD